MKAGDPNLEFLVVRPARGGTDETVRSYLYGHSHVLDVAAEGYGQVLTVVVASSQPAGVEFLATYQVDRLRSGGHRVQRADTLAQAIELAKVALRTE